MGCPHKNKTPASIELTGVIGPVRAGRLRELHREIATSNASSRRNRSQRDRGTDATAINCPRGPIRRAFLLAAMSIANETLTRSSRGLLELGVDRAIACNNCRGPRRQRDLTPCSGSCTHPEMVAAGGGRVNSKPVSPASQVTDAAVVHPIADDDSFPHCRHRWFRSISSTGCGRR